ncbi:hypothetical protein H2200_003344 [Cladophialophora chaetospira]|uniref:Uncharacterized protein n=1 Tax=Cladophialophora chaetospira TaxID=386627 RepID=A0AA39CM72_9EURO|nr:hypothetical protein H2200_003344 [Cladophialophora chaetospira]
MFFLWLFACLGTAVSLDYKLPTSTSFFDDAPDPHGWTPRPTQVPNLPMPTLFRRQDTPDDQDYICGYVDGNSGSPLNCPNVNYGCYIMEGTLTSSNLLGCCTVESIDEYGSIVPGGCLVETTCYGATEYLEICTEPLADWCTDDDVNILMCTEADATYCGSFYGDFYMAYGCFTEPNEARPVYSTATDATSDGFAEGSDYDQIFPLHTVADSATSGIPTSTSFDLFFTSSSEGTASTISPTSTAQASATTVASTSSASSDSTPILRSGSLAAFVLASTLLAKAGLLA